MVGKDEEKFVMHKEWMKSEEKVLLLPDDMPNIVRIFLCWIYRNRIVMPVWEKEDTNDSSKACTNI